MWHAFGANIAKDLGGGCMEKTEAATTAGALRIQASLKVDRDEARKLNLEPATHPRLTRLQD